jgi:hypothetical protein
LLGTQGIGDSLTRRRCQGVQFQDQQDSTLGLGESSTGLGVAKNRPNLLVLT